MKDAIKPAHYNDLSPTPLEVIDAWGLNFSLGNTLKYIARAGKKNPDKEIEDLEKGLEYLTHEINRLKNNKQD